MGETQADRTLWVGNLDERITEELLYELFLQAGPLAGVKRPSEKNYAFVEFKHDVSVPYSIQLMGGLRLFERSLRLQFRSGSKHDSGSSTLMSGSSSPVMSPPMGGMMMPNSPMGMGMTTPPPLQHSLSMPVNPHMQRQYNPGMGGPPPPMGGGGLLGPGPPQAMAMHSHPGGHMGNRFNQAPMHNERDGSPSHHAGRPHERHRSRDGGDRRGSSDLRSYSPPLGQSPDFGHRRESFQGKEESPSRRDFHRRPDDRNRERGGGHHWHGDERQEHEHGGHHNRSRDRGRHGQGHHDGHGHHRHRDDRSRSSDRHGRYRDDSRDRFNRSGRY